MADKRYFYSNFNAIRESLARGESLARAAKGDSTMLVARLRARREPELDFAADFIESNRKRPANRPRTQEKFQRDLDIYYFVGDRVAVGDPIESAVKAAEKKFTLSRSTIYEILTEIEASPMLELGLFKLDRKSAK